jgi:dipeptidyl aminopeptidase/acylaminoacyl peptidase
MIIRISLFAACFAASAAAAQPAPGPAALYGFREAVEAIDISPDGTHVVYLAPDNGRGTIVYYSRIGGETEPVAILRSNGNPERLRWCNFVTNERLICQVRGMTEGALNGIGLLVPFSRLISVDTAGRNLTMLGQRDSVYDERARFHDGSILDWLGGQESAVLMAREHVPEAGRQGTRLARTANGLAVERIDPATGRSTRVEAPNPNAAGYISDGRGHVRIMSAPVTTSAARTGSQMNYYYRTSGGGEWQRLGSSGTDTASDMIPLGVDSALDSAYFLRKLNGRQALYRIKLDGSMATELVYANEQVDVDDVVHANRGARIIGVTFAEERRQINYFDNDYAALARSLSSAIPNSPQINFGTTSADGNRVIIHAGSDTDAGRFYVYDRSARSLSEILMVRPQLESVATAQVRAVSYPAADGVMVPAYLTLPPGSDGRNLPAVILPHGGPEARDEWGFDWLPQYLAHLGYAVLQPNFRGSAGYGDAWLQRNGFQGWRTSIGDISAGARWLAAQNIADPGRMAIVGWSYGGYAALQSGVAEPGLYRAIVAIAPVTDLQQLRHDFDNYSNARSVARFVGEGPHVREGSPAQNAAAIRAPVLLFHGERDLNVAASHSRRMDAALREAGRSSTLSLFPGLEHDLADSQVRTQMLERIGTFLAANTGAR